MLSGVKKPKTQKGRRVLENRAPKLIENDKRTLLIKGRHTSEVVNRFLKDLHAVKQPLAIQLKWHNSVLPFDDMSFVEKMCEKYDCSLFVVAMHSKKRPNNVIIGRMHDNDLLDMFELGISNYTPLNNSATSVYGEKPMLIFSGELFDQDNRFRTMKSLLIDLFRGPVVEKIRSLGIEHQFHFILKSADRLLMRVRKISLSSVPVSLHSITNGNVSFQSPDENMKLPLRTPSGKMVHLSLHDATPHADFELRRFILPSEDKWNQAHRVPLAVRKAEKVQTNKHVDVFGSHMGRVHVGKSAELNAMRPGSTLRTALTGRRKRGFDRPKVKLENKRSTPVSDGSVTKRRKLCTKP